MASRTRQTTRSSSYRSNLRLESLERRCVLSASIGLTGVTIRAATNPTAVADFRPAVSNSTIRLPSETPPNSTVDLSTIEAKMPAGLPEGTIERLEHPFPPLNTVPEEVARMPETGADRIQLRDMPFPPLYTTASPNSPTGQLHAPPDPFVSTVLPRTLDRASVQSGLSGDSAKTRLIGPRLLPRTVSVPVATLSSNDAAASPTSDAGGRSTVGTRLVVPVNLKTTAVNAFARPSSQGEIAKKVDEQPRPPVLAIAARDIALMELASRAFKMKPFGRQIGTTF